MSVALKEAQPILPEKTEYRSSIAKIYTLIGQPTAAALACSLIVPMGENLSVLSTRYHVSPSQALVRLFDRNYHINKPPLVACYPGYFGYLSQMMVRNVLGSQVYFYLLMNNYFYNRANETRWTLHETIGYYAAGSAALTWALTPINHWQVTRASADPLRLTPQTLWAGASLQMLAQALAPILFASAELTLNPLLHEYLGEKATPNFNIGFKAPLEATLIGGLTYPLRVLSYHAQFRAARQLPTLSHQKLIQTLYAQGKFSAFYEGFSPALLMSYLPKQFCLLWLIKEIHGLAREEKYQQLPSAQRHLYALYRALRAEKKESLLSPSPDPATPSIRP